MLGHLRKLRFSATPAARRFLGLGEGMAPANAIRSGAEWIASQRQTVRLWCKTGFEPGGLRFQFAELQKRLGRTLARPVCQPAAVLGRRGTSSQTFAILIARRCSEEAGMAQADVLLGDCDRAVRRCHGRRRAAPVCGEPRGTAVEKSDWTPTPVRVVMIAPMCSTRFSVCTLSAQRLRGERTGAWG